MSHQVSTKKSYSTLHKRYLLLSTQRFKQLSSTFFDNYKLSHFFCFPFSFMERKLKTNLWRRKMKSKKCGGSDKKEVGNKKYVKEGAKVKEESLSIPPGGSYPVSGIINMRWPGQYVGRPSTNENLNSYFCCKIDFQH